MTRKLITLTLILFAYSAAFSQEDEAYSKTLKQMFAVSGAEGSYKAVINQFTTMFRQKYPDVDSKVWDEFEKEFSKASMDDLADMLVPTYKKYMTIDDLKELIKFYETPVGKKYAQYVPNIMQESMQVGQEWGMKIGQQLEERMKEKGY
ncbi:MAG: DUF2059 domain-containing protein [Cyclobacteriaceae bacterium]|nr:DUF2059 domain-containing protein [Cyclobacteriaceae bacterium SS2]